MIRKPVIALLFSFIAFYSFAQKRDVSFDRFWTSFRKAVMDKKYDSLAAYTQFPLVVKGTLDLDPIKKFNHDKFKYIFGHYLKQLYALDYIVENEKIPEKEFHGGSLSTFRFSDMEFKKIKGKWKLSLIYIETLYQEENNIK